MDHESRQIKELIAAINITLDAENIPDDAEIVSEQILDSFGFVDLLTRLEEMYGITIEDNEVTGENFKTVRKIVGFIHQKQAN